MHYIQDTKCIHNLKCHQDTKSIHTKYKPKCLHEIYQCIIAWHTKALEHGTYIKRRCVRDYIKQICHKFEKAKESKIITQKLPRRRH